MKLEELERKKKKKKKGQKSVDCLFEDVSLDIRKKGSYIFLFSIERSKGKIDRSIDPSIVDRIEVDGRFLQRR